MVKHQTTVVAQTLNIGTPVRISVSNMPSVDSIEDFVTNIKTNAPIIDNECFLYLEQNNDMVVCTNEQNAQQKIAYFKYYEVEQLALVLTFRSKTKSAMDMERLTHFWH